MKREHRRLADAIEILLSEGIRLSRDVLHCLDSMSGIDSPRALENAFCGPPDSETGSLVELIFFPDRSQQALLEPILEKTVFNEADIDSLIDRLIRIPIVTHLHFPDAYGACRVSIPVAALRRFVHRLNLTRVIDPRISEVFKAYPDPGFAIRIRVMLRNARFPFYENIVSFILDFLAGMDLSDSDYLGLFAFSCDTLERIGPADDIHAAFIARRRHYADMIRQSRDSDRQLSVQPVEALMLKGIHIVSVDVEEATRQIEWIDRICLAAFGRIDPADCLCQSEESNDLGVFENGCGDIETVIKILS